MDEYEEEFEIQKMKWTFITGFLFLASAYYSFAELRYAIWGATTEGVVTQSRLDVDKERLTIRYTFKELSGKERSENDTVPGDWDVPDMGPIIIQYIPGSAASRVSGNSHTWWIYMFLGSLIVFGFCLRWLCKLANEPIRRSGSRRRRRK